MLRTVGEKGFDLPQIAKENFPYLILVGGSQVVPILLIRYKNMKKGKVLKKDLKKVPKKDTEDKPKEKEEGLKGDYGALALLMLLYTLQGIPMGLSGSIALLLAERKITTADQALFSIIAYPFAFKLLWAPIVDSIYSSAFGRRKTWIVPIQSAIGVLLIASASRVEVLMGPIPDVQGASMADIKSLTALFFVFYFLAATQDIAVDGLALSVLSERNKELGATCNAIGQTLGYFFA